MGNREQATGNRRVPHPFCSFKVVALSRYHGRGVKPPIITVLILLAQSREKATSLNHPPGMRACSDSALSPSAYSMKDGRMIVENGENIFVIHNTSHPKGLAFE